MTPRQPTSRRQFLGATAATTLAALPGLLPGVGQAAVQGNTNPASWAVTSDAALYARAWTARFSNVLLNPLAAGYLYAADAGTPNTFTISAGQASQDVLGLVNAGRPVLTKIWGYQNAQMAAPAFPGRTFEVQTGTPIVVRWNNGLRDAKGLPLPHLFAVDQTISIQAPTTGVPLAVHHHGGDTAAEFDGGPDQWSTPLRVQVGPGITAANTDQASTGLRYQYTNAQEASMHWYHDHAEGLTRINVGAGLAGLYVLRDSNEARLQALGYLPARQHEMALVIQDRTFTASGDFSYTANPVDYPGALSPQFPANSPTHMPEMFGDVILVNGKAWPNAVVEPRPYRLRVLNGSDSRFYTLSFGTAPVLQVGTDLGLLNASVAIKTLTIAPGERADLVVDFSALAGAAVVLGNSAAAPFPGGLAPATGSGVSQVMRFTVTAPFTAAVPRALAQANVPLRGYTTAAPVIKASGLALPGPATAGIVHRQILLGEGVDQYGRITPMLGNYTPRKPATNRGTLSFADPATETPALGSTEVWSIHNVSVDSHPVHFHLVQFQVRHRQALKYVTQATVMSNGWQGVKIISAADMGNPQVPPSTAEAGWKDTVVCPPGQVTTVVMRFNRPGKFVYHCHILSHEEHDMMRWFTVA